MGAHPELRPYRDCAAATLASPPPSTLRYGGPEQAMGHPTVENETPFAFDIMSLADEEGRPLLVLVVKATYSLGEPGLKLADEIV